MASTVLALAILAGIGVITYANKGTAEANSTAVLANDVLNDTNIVGDNMCDFGGHHRGGMGGFFAGEVDGGGRSGFVTVSQEFKDNVINITESDQDVQKLLSDGYNITGVRPIINAVVQADGSVTVKATMAIVTMAQNTTGRATVWVDMEQAKVTRIEIMSITVIEKP